jgi:tetratricopeptide (TPR) repeat protein
MERRLLPHADSMPMLESFLWTPIWVDLRFAKWQEVLARPEPPANRKVPHLMWRYSRTLAYAARRQAAKADAEHSLYTKEAAALADENPIGQMNPNQAMLAVMNEVAAAKLDSGKGDAESAIKHWRAAAEAQDKLNYTEPPDWYYPVRESLGAALLESGQAKQAEEIFRDDLRRNPRNPRSLFGLEESLAAQHLDNVWVRREFEKVWKGTEMGLKIADL